MQNISKCTFPGCFPAVSRAFPGRSQAQFSLSLFYFVKNPHSFPGISWVFPGCFPGVPEHFFCTLLLLLKIIPTTFVKEVFILKHASLIQNLSKCSFPGCFPANGIPAHLFNNVWRNVFHDIRP